MTENRGLRSLVRPFSRRLNLVVWVNASLGWTLGVAGLYATALIALKVAFPEGARYAHALLALFPVVLVAGWIAARRRGAFFRTTEILEIADRLYRNDGSVTASYEQPRLMSGPDFFAEVKGEVWPRRPRLDARHYGKRILPVLLYCGIALVLPPRPPTPTQQAEEILAALTEPLYEKIEESQPLLSEEQREELIEEIQAISENNLAVTREQWEAIEDLEKRIDDAAKLGENALSELATKVDEISSRLDSSGATSATQMSSPEMQEMMNDLADLMKNAEGRLSRPFEGNLQGMMEGMRSAMSPGDLGDRLDDLRSRLSEMLDEGSLSGDGAAGRGGIDRGRGDALLVLGEEQTLDGAAYEEKQLANKYLSPDDLVSLGITPIEPKPDPGRFSPGTVREFGSETGSEVSRTRISPGQKDVVGKYFGE
ncbi:hypothetical protein JW916_15945 [Candidatus Sumerlaeota bacterium]|nr:hypothetical protein [Candidatus Sumerlaeota bacterium]